MEERASIEFAKSAPLFQKARLHGLRMSASDGGAAIDPSLAGKSPSHRHRLPILNYTISRYMRDFSRCVRDHPYSVKMVSNLGPSQAESPRCGLKVRSLAISKATSMEPCGDRISVNTLM